VANKQVALERDCLLNHEQKKKILPKDSRKRKEHPAHDQDSDDDVHCTSDKKSFASLFDRNRLNPNKRQRLTSAKDKSKRTQAPSQPPPFYKQIKNKQHHEPLSSRKECATSNNNKAQDHCQQEDHQPMQQENTEIAFENTILQTGDEYVDMHIRRIHVLNRKLRLMKSNINSSTSTLKTLQSKRNLKKMILERRKHLLIIKKRCDIVNRASTYHEWYVPLRSLDDMKEFPVNKKDVTLGKVIHNSKHMINPMWRRPHPDPAHVPINYMPHETMLETVHDTDKDEASRPKMLYRDYLRLVNKRQSIVQGSTVQETKPFDEQQSPGITSAELEKHSVSSPDINMMVTKVDYASRDGRVDIYLYGVTQDRNSVMIRVTDFEPYFYVELPVETPTVEQIQELIQEVNDLLQKNKKLRDNKSRVTRVNVERKVPIYGYQGPTHKMDPNTKIEYSHLKRRTMAQVFFSTPQCVTTARSYFEQKRITAMGLDKYNPNSPTYESKLPFVLRFLVDKKIKGASWVRIPGAHARVPKFHQDFISSCQIEKTIHYQHIEAYDPSNSDWSMIAPVRFMSFDIECESLKHFPRPYDRKIDNDVYVGGNKVICIAAHVWEYGISEPVSNVIFGLRKRNPIPGFTCLTFDEEKDLMLAFQNYIKELDPDVLTGYNSVNFDTWYLVERSRALGIYETFSHLGRNLSEKTRIETKTFTSRAYGSRDTRRGNISGRWQKDVLEIVRREKKLDSYTLNNVAGDVLGRYKDEVHHTMIKVLQDGSEQDLTILAHYCAIDCILPKEISAKLMHMPNYTEMSRVTCTPLDFLIEKGQQIKVVSQMAVCVQDKGFVIDTPIKTGTSSASSSSPNKKKKKKTTATEKHNKHQDSHDEPQDSPSSDSTFSGATVIEPVTGIYFDPIVTLDFASLYPSIMIAFNLCYVTFLVGVAACEFMKNNPGMYEKTPLTRKDPKTGQDDPNYAACFVKRRNMTGILPLILTNLLSARKTAQSELKQEKDPFKKAVLDGRQLALKISANSVFGFTGATIGHLPCLEISGSVTAYGRNMIEQSRSFVEREYGAQVIYGDTDSVMINYGPITVEKAFELGKESAKRITEEMVKGDKDNPINLAFEKVYYPYLLIAKKRYAGRKWMNTSKPLPGVDKKGLEAARRDGLSIVRKAQNAYFDILLQKPDKETIQQLTSQRDRLALLLSEIDSSLASQDHEKMNAVHLQIANALSCARDQIGANEAVHFVQEETATGMYDSHCSQSKATLSISEQRQAVLWELRRVEQKMLQSLPVNKAVSQVEKYAEKVAKGELDISELVISKSLSKEPKDYNPKGPHVTLAERLAAIDPDSAPKKGDRVAYVLRKGTRKEKKSQRSMVPLEAMKTKQEVDYGEALEKYIKSMSRVLVPVLGEEETARVFYSCKQFTPYKRIPKISGSILDYVVRAGRCINCKCTISGATQTTRPHRGPFRLVRTNQQTSTHMSGWSREASDLHDDDIDPLDMKDPKRAISSEFKKRLREYQQSQRFYFEIETPVTRIGIKNKLDGKMHDIKSIPEMGPVLHTTSNQEQSLAQVNEPLFLFTDDQEMVHKYVIHLIKEADHTDPFWNEHDKHAPCYYQEEEEEEQDDNNEHGNNKYGVQKKSTDEPQDCNKNDPLEREMKMFDQQCKHKRAVYIARQKQAQVLLEQKGFVFPPVRYTDMIKEKVELACFETNDQDPDLKDWIIVSPDMCNVPFYADDQKTIVYPHKSPKEAMQRLQVFLRIETEQERQKYDYECHDVMYRAVPMICQDCDDEEGVTRAIHTARLQRRIDNHKISIEHMRKTCIACQGWDRYIRGSCSNDSCPIFYKRIGERQALEELEIDLFNLENY